MKRILTATLALTFPIITFALPGTQGQDWDSKTVQLKNGVEVVIQGQVTTKNTTSGNSSSIILYIDGIEKRRIGGDRAQNTVTFNYTGDGTHKIEVACSNTNADADTCTLNVTESEIEVFGNKK